MKRLKDIIKQNPEPARGKSGIDPLAPWGAKAGIAEASEQQLLNQFLKSRGINPNFVSTDTKISHSKSGKFLQWKQNHQHTFGEESILEATDDADVILDQQIDEVNYDTVKSLYTKRKEMRDGPSKKSKEVKVKNVGTSISRLAGHKLTQKQPFDKIDKGTHYELKPKNEEVEQIVEISKKTVKSWLGQQKPIPEKKPDEQRKAFNVRIKKRSKSWDGAIDRLTDRKPTSEEVLDEAKMPKTTALDRWRAAADEREKKHNDIEKKRQEKLHQDPSKVTVPVADTNKDDMTSAIDRLEKHLNKESVQAERTKSARIIKSLYKAKGVKEETYDWEKDDKAQSYGKKPKIDKPDGQDNMDQKKPQARAVMVGGTTLTGIKRDTVEIDPLMKNVVPGQMAFDRLSKK